MYLALPLGRASAVRYGRGLTRLRPAPHQICPRRLGHWFGDGEEHDVCIRDRSSLQRYSSHSQHLCAFENLFLLHLGHIILYASFLFILVLYITTDGNEDTHLLRRDKLKRRVCPKEKKKKRLLILHGSLFHPAILDR